MLEKIRTLLEEEYKKILKNIRDNKENYAKNELYIALKKKAMDAYYAKEAAHKKIIESPILMVISNFIGGFIFFSTPLALSALQMGIPFIFINLYFMSVLIYNVKKYKKNKSTFEELQREIFTSYPEHGTFMLINEFALQYDREKQEDIRRNIYTDETYARGLYDILQDDDLIKKMKQYNYHLYKELFKDVLETEWQLYLEEISKLPYRDNNFTDKECLKEVKPVTLDLKQKREKSHNLAIK